MDRMIRIFFFLLAMTFSGSCMPQSKNNIQNKSLKYCEAIDSPGIYNLKNKNLSLNISYRENFVMFKALDEKENTIFINNHLNISKYQKWCCCIDSSNILWIDSSDIGLYKIDLNKAGDSSQVSNFGEINQSNVDSIPKCIYDKMPDCIKVKKEL